MAPDELAHARNWQIKRPKPVEEKSILPTAQDENHALLEEPLLQAEDHEDLHKEPDLV